MNFAGLSRQPHRSYMLSGMKSAKEAKRERARRLIDELAATGDHTDYISIQNAARGRGLDREIDDLLAGQSLRDDVKAMCDKARKERR